MPKSLPVVDTTGPVCCQPVSAGPIDRESAVGVAVRLKALADPVRLQILSLLLSNEHDQMCTSDFASLLNIADSTTSHHLSVLKKAGVVTSSRTGMNVYYLPSVEALEALRHVLNPCCR